MTHITFEAEQYLEAPYEIVSGDLAANVPDASITIPCRDT
jgi:hypothetical protein